MPRCLQVDKKFRWPSAPAGPAIGQNASLISAALKEDGTIEAAMKLSGGMFACNVMSFACAGDDGQVWYELEPCSLDVAHRCAGSHAVAALMLPALPIVTK